ncbi:hypothetical protein ACFLW7_01640 [Chloroflexota bacterium]
MGSEEGEHHTVEQVWVLFLNIDGGSIDVKKLAMLSAQAVRGYLRLRLAKGYQVGNSPKKENEGQYYVRQYS